MKIKSLQINVLTVLLGVSILVFSPKTFANNVEKSPVSGQFNNPDGDELQRSQANQVTGKIDIKDVIAARQQAEILQMKGGKSIGFNWTFKGPDNTAGKINAIISDNRDANTQTFYAGSAHGGLWKSVNMGVNWSKIAMPNGINLFVTCLTQMPNGTIFVGTGGDFPGQGIYKSTDGFSFTLIEGTQAWHSIYSISAASDAAVFAATDNGLFFYNGQEWSQCEGTKNGSTVSLKSVSKSIDINPSGFVIASVGTDCYVSQGANPKGFVYSKIAFSEPLSTLSVAISNSGILYVSGANAKGQLAGSYRSDDQGSTWIKVFAAFIFERSPDGIDPLDGNGDRINRIYIDPASDSIIYIGSVNLWKGQRIPNSTGFYDFGLSSLSSSSGAASSPGYIHSGVNEVAFGKVNEKDKTREVMIATNGGVYFATIYLEVGTLVPVARNKTLNVASYNSVASNTDGNILGGCPTVSVQLIGNETNTPINARPIWSLAMASSLYTTEGNGGNGVISLTLVKKEQYVEPLYIYSRLSETPQIDGTGMNRSYSIRRSENTGYSYQPSDDGNVGWMPDALLNATYKLPFVMWEKFNAPYTPDTVWFKANVTNNFVLGDRFVFARSKNYDFPIKYDLPAGVTLKDGDSIKVPDNFQNRFYISTVNKVYMTREALQLSQTIEKLDGNKKVVKISWFQIAELNAKDTANFFAASVDGNTIYAGSRSGNIYRISNLLTAHDSATADMKGANYQVINQLIKAFEKRIVTAIAIDPNDPNHLIVTLGNYGNSDYVYETKNALSEEVTFTSIQYDLPKAPAYSALISKENSTLIVGSEFGLYYLPVGQTSWTMDDVIGQSPVYTLSQVTTHRPQVSDVRVAGKDGIIYDNYPSNNSNYLAIYLGTYGAGTFVSRKEVGIGEIDPIVNNVTIKGNLKVVPNPVKDVATIELDLKAGETAKVQLFDINGRCILTQETRSNLHTINFEQLVQGVYMIRVTQGTKMLTGKVVKVD